VPEVRLYPVTLMSYSLQSHPLYAVLHVQTPESVAVPAVQDVNAWHATMHAFAS